MTTQLSLYASAWRWLLMLPLIALAASCDFQENLESRGRLADAAHAMELNPKEAQQLLRSVRAEWLSDEDYAYYLLVQARVADKNGVDISQLDTLVERAATYFTEERLAPQAAFACFVQAKVYAAQKTYSKALFYSFLADDWAGKANYRIPDFLYSAIPYNIALLCYKEGRYDESLLFLEKAFKHIEYESGSFRDKLYALELKALNFRALSKVNNALSCLDEALTTAIEYKDTLSSNRILYNKYALLYITREFSMAEKSCKQLLPTLTASNDSLHVGMTHMMLALIYANTNRADSASVSIGKASELLKGAKSNIRLSLYEVLTLVAQKKGNHAKASGYQRQYNEYKAELESKYKVEQAELAKLEEAYKQNGKLLAINLLDMGTSRDFLENRKKNDTTLILIVMSSLLLAIFLKLLFSGGGELISSLRFDLSADKRDPDVAMARLTKGELLRWTARSEEVRMVMQGAERKCPSDDRMVRISYMVDDLVPPDDWSWRRLSPSANCSYAELMGMLRRDFPQLEEKELEICTLLYTQRLKARQMADIIQVELPEFKEQRKSMKHKLREAGYTSGCIRKYVRNCVYNSSGKLN